MKGENKPSSNSDLFGCCFGGIFLKKIHFSSQELVLPGEKQKLDELIPEAHASVVNNPINPPPYSLHANTFHTNELGSDIANCHESQKSIAYPLQIVAGGTSNDQYIHDNDSDKTYFLGKLLGKGGFAKCFELKDTRTQKIFAGKIISKLKLTKPRQKEKILYEISLHSTLNHRHVVNFYNSFEDDFNVYIILEFCSKKSLVHTLKARLKLTEAEVRYYLVQLLNGVQYIHSQNVIHRDLKLGNMLLNESMQIKIADFGLATKIEFPGEKKMTVCGTPNYIAPEVLQKKGHSYEVDIWAIGCIIYALLCGRPPFETNSLKETYLRISANRYHMPSHLSSAAKRIICKLLRPDPKCRPSLEEILKDDFITSFFTPHYLPTSCCEIEPKFNTTKHLSLGDERRLSKITEKQSILFPNTNLNGRHMSLIKVQISGIDKNLKNEIQRKNTFSDKPKIKFQNKRVVLGSKISPSMEASGSLVPKNLERYCKSIKMMEINEDLTNKVSELEQLFSSSVENTLENKALDNNIGVSPFSAIRLYRALSHCLESMPAESSINPLSAIHPLWVTKWVDYSNKYGFGFQLSDLSVGILFNDTTRMVLSSDGRNLTYNDLSNQTFVYATNLAPKEQRKKVTLLLYFSQYMEEHLIHGAEVVKSLEMKKKERFEKSNVSNINGTGNVFMRKWFRTDKAIVMHLSNGTLQINFFDDHTKLILSVDEQDYLATFINNHKQSVSYRLLSITNFGCRYDVVDRLKYARKMLEGVINLGGETV